MKKLSPLFRLFSLILAMILLVACTGIDVRSLKENQSALDATPVSATKQNTPDAACEIQINYPSFPLCLF